ncbi:MAG: hypothetical protein WA705_05160 [Candidatus Ozemobacteraceae bacterium]
MENFIKDFLKLLPTLKCVERKIPILISDLLEAEEIFPHSVTSRIKTKESLQGKLEKKFGKYSKIGEIQDLVGIRIITLMEEEFEKVVNIISKDFEIDRENSIDKKEVLDPDRFGYISYHLICKISDSRANLPENKEISDIFFEIQIRSILQHAWAEIEHNLGYKSNIEVPRDFRRRFSRIAGILEVADIEFCSLKRDLEIFQENLKKQSPVADIELNKDSLTNFIKSSNDVSRLDKKFCDITGSVYSKNLISGTTELLGLKRVGIKTVAKLNEALLKKEKAIFELIPAWIDYSRKYESFSTRGLPGYAPIGICIYYFVIVTAAENFALKGFINFCAERNISSPSSEEAGKFIYATINSK